MLAIKTSLLMTMLLAVVAPPTRGNADQDGFSQDDWATVLKNFVDSSGNVDYEGLAADRDDLDRYLSKLKTTGPKSNPKLFPTRDSQLAYYINAYNALVFAGVLDRGPEQDSVWKGGLISGYRFFVKAKWTLDGSELSLKSLEDDLIREGFDDPRIHAALNCASISCPRLPAEPFLVETLQKQLDAAITEFVNDPRHVKIEGEDVRISKIFDWFKSDFNAHEGAHGGRNLVSYINRYRESSSRLSPDASISFFGYDKGINSQRKD